MAAIILRVFSFHLVFYQTYIVFCEKVTLLDDAFLANVDGFMRETSSCVESMKRRFNGANANAESTLQSRFSLQQLSLLCAKKNQWTQKADDPSSLQRDPSSVLNRRQTEWLFSIRICKSPEQCFCNGDLGSALCNTTSNLRLAQIKQPDLSSKQVVQFDEPFRTGARRKRQTEVRWSDFKERVIRKEYRQMSSEERARFHNAINKLKSDTIDGKSKYDMLVMYHTPQESPGAHWGPAFLPWHRELLKQLEVAMRLYDPKVFLPYWDSTLDEGLPNPADSILWTEMFMGNGIGYVTTGPFANWTTIHSVLDEPRIVRNVGVSPLASLFQPGDVEQILNKPDFAHLTSCVDPYLELTHGVVHISVGGHMADIAISPNDPSFFMHHAFVDYIWDAFRRFRQTEDQRKTSYPTHEQCCNEHHYFDALMLPFPFVRNQDGLDESYTNDFYKYQTRPTCRGRSLSCGSEFLFCHEQKRCLSKVKLGGRCDGFEGTEICYGGDAKAACVRGVCTLLEPAVVTSLPVVETSRFISVSNATVLPLTQPAVSSTESLPSVTRTATAASSSTTLRPIEKKTTKNVNAFVGDGKNCKCTCENDEQLTVQDFTENSTIANDNTKNAKSNSNNNNSVPRISNTVFVPITVLDGQTTDLVPRGADDVTIFSVLLNTADQVFKGFMHEPRIDLETNQTIFPFFDGAGAIEIPNPLHNNGHVEAQLLVRNARGDLCQSYCLDVQKGYVECSGTIVLDVDPSKSDPVAYTPFREQLLYLSWMGNVKLPTTFMFTCNKKPLEINKKPKKKSCSFIKFKNWMLVGLAQQVHNNFSLEDCSRECKKYPTMQLGQDSSVEMSSDFKCLSFMFWPDFKECVLNEHSRETTPQLFLYSKEDNVHYYEQICDLEQFCTL